MGKVNLRNRLRENRGEEPGGQENNIETPSGINSGIDEPSIAPISVALEPTLIDTTPSPPIISSRLEKKAPVNDIMDLVNDTSDPLGKSPLSVSETQPIVPKITPPPATPLPETMSEPAPIINRRLNPQPPIITPPVPETQVNKSSGLFKDEDENSEEAKFKNLFGTKKLGTRKLFPQKGEGPVKNINAMLDRFNINKRMFYLAVGCAGIASVLVISYLNSFSADKLFNSEMVPVLIANKNIKEKATLNLNDLAKRDIPKKYVLKNSLILDGKMDPKTLVGQVAITDIYEGEQISLKRVVKAEDSPWLSPSVPLNHRAFTITSRSMSYVKPGDHVDVVVTVPDPEDKARMLNTPVLQNSIVLAVDGRYKIGRNEILTSGNSITLAVPNNLVSLFTVLQSKGNFQLFLRKEDDTTTLETKFSIAQLEVMLNSNEIRIPKPETPKVPQSNPKPPVSAVIEPVYNPPVYNPPVYQRPAYIPPVRVYNPPKPKVTKPVVSKPVKAPVVQKPVSTAPPRTVTVINGTSVNQHTIPGENKPK